MPLATNMLCYRKTSWHVLHQKHFFIYIYIFFCHFEMSVAMYRLLQKVKCILEQLHTVAQIRPYWWTPCPLLCVCNTEQPPPPPSAPRGWRFSPVCALYATVRWAEPLILWVMTAVWQPEGFHLSSKQFWDQTVCIISRSEKVVLQDAGLWK